LILAVAYLPRLAISAAAMTGDVLGLCKIIC
jgi:hypothetical protein